MPLSVEEQRILDDVVRRIKDVEAYVGVGGTAPRTDVPGNVAPAIKAELDKAGIVVSASVESALRPVTGVPTSGKTVAALQAAAIPVTPELLDALAASPVPTVAAPTQPMNPAPAKPVDKADQIAQLEAELAALKAAG
jgi:hypothetical protein